MTRVAPHLVRPLPLLLAVEREHAARRAKLVAALSLYGAVACSRHALPRVVRPRRARELVPALDPSAVALCGLVAEAQTHDARLTLATVRGAVASGATALSYVRLVELEHARGAVVGAVLHDLDGGRELALSCRAAVNATGPWVDHVRRLDRGAAPPLARLSRGVHAVLPLDRPWHAGVALFDESRSALAVPWQGMLLVGATDAEHDGEPGCASATGAEIAAVLDPLRAVLGGSLDPSRVVHSFAGLRVLPRGPGDTARASRRHLVEVSPSGLVSIAGGKLTTHRTIAVDVLRRLPPDVRPRLERASADPLPGAGEATLHLDAGLAAHLTGLYGSDAARVAAYAGSVPGALERIDDRGPDVVAQVLFARDVEHALTVDDVVSRRTTLAMRGLAGPDVRGRIASLLVEAPEAVPA
jgi:glycerol-3-phosphate dehydrogenase